MEGRGGEGRKGEIRGAKIPPHKLEGPSLIGPEVDLCCCLGWSILDSFISNKHRRYKADSVVGEG